MNCDCAVVAEKVFVIGGKRLAPGVIQAYHTNLEGDPDKFWIEIDLFNEGGVSLPGIKVILNQNHLQLIREMLNSEVQEALEFDQDEE